MGEDITPEAIKKTQKILGRHVKKPILTEKLLKKPPFRFLHDVVSSVIKETGFLKGLFSADELLSENVKEKEAKVAFLNKLIDAVKTITKNDLTVRASKVVAGLEPLKTNLLLQAIGKAIDDKVDASEYIAQLNSGKADATEKKKLKKVTPIKDEKSKTSKKIKEDSTNKIIKTKKSNESPRNKTKASTPKQQTSSRSKSKVDKSNKISDSVQKNIEEVSVNEVDNASDNAKVITTSKENAATINNVNENHITDIQYQNISLDNKVNDQTKEFTESSFNHLNDTVNLNISDSKNKNEEGNNGNIENTEIKNVSESLVRPKSARSKTGNGNNVSKQTNVNNGEDEASKPMHVIASQPQRPKSSLRPPSVRPSSARPGAPRLRPDSALPLQETVTMGNINVIVENVDNMDDEETVIIQSTPEVTEENFISLEVPQDNKGQLVEQILEQIQEEGEGVKKKVDIDWENGLHNKDGAAKEINQLRSLIQTLTRTANPLGKLMNYLHEDVDAMHGELQMWTNIKNQLFSEIQKQKRLSVESNKPLLNQLEHIQEEIKKQQQEILTVRSNILRNELRIKELLNI